MVVGAVGRADHGHEFFTMRTGNFLILLIALSICGCATVSTNPKKEILFYPPAPEPPRLQYLTSFSSSKDIEGETKGFAKFVLGDEAINKPIVKPYGINLRDGKIYVCDTVANAIEILDLKNKTFQYFQPQGGGRLLEPINMDVDSKGQIYVADTRTGQVQIYDPAGTYLSSIGAQGELKPTDVTIWNNLIFICDLKSQQVRVYSLLNNKFLYAVPKSTEDAQGKLFSPTNVAIDSAGNIYVSDIGDFSIKKYTPGGVFVKVFGGLGDRPGQLARPKGIAIDKDDRIYVVDAAFENVQIFAPDGKLLLFFPQPDDAARLVLPAGIAIDYKDVDYFQSYVADNFEVQYLVLVASQYGDKKVSVFGFGKRK